LPPDVTGRPGHQDLVHPHTVGASTRQPPASATSMAISVFEYGLLMESIDDLDRGLVHALQLDGRAPFSKIAEVLGVSENTVARRYRRLRSGGLLRVVGTTNGYLLGYTSWTIRIRCTPDAAAPIAAALARRPDTFWV